MATKIRKDGTVSEKLGRPKLKRDGTEIPTDAMPKKR